MPTSMHPQAKFDPIPPDLDLQSLVDGTPNLKWAQRITRAQARNLGSQQFQKLVLFHVIQGGKPLVIEGFDSVLPKSLFNADWLEQTYDKKQENVRDIQTGGDIPMTMGHYLRSMKQLTRQWNPTNFRDERRQRLYLKDIDCPREWQESLQKIITPSLYYLNENVDSSGNADSVDGHHQPESTAAPAGDLMSSLPVEMRAENLMCYIGHEGTYTPAHREMCASLGQNIMVEASEATNGEVPGSSIWFMTESKEREVVREYFLSMLGHDIEIEKHFAQINAWKKAPFDVHVVEQRPGDFILIPPLAAHQVWNRGTRTMKIAWNRTTVETLELALQEALPKARLVCRDEQYKNKAIIYFTLEKYYNELQSMGNNAALEELGFTDLGRDLIRNSPGAKQLMADFRTLFGLFTQVLVDEVFAFREKDIEFIPFDSCITCSYCRSNIFNRFLTCKHCVRSLINGDEDTYDVCMECYAMGRSCACLSGLKWCEQWHWNELVNSYETWRAAVISNDGFIDIDSSPQAIEVARQRSGRKSVAQICQDALKRRPWKDITQPERDTTPSDSGPDPYDEAAKKKAKKKRKKKKGQLERCHVCCHKDYSYRVQKCSNSGCLESYCYGVLYRAFDMMPQKVLEDENWQCPKCLGICNCGHCRRTGNTNAYMPKNTSLGHDTRRVADDRSVEALVDFRLHNLSWLKAAGEEGRSRNTRRMQRLREQADSAKADDPATHEDVGDAMQQNSTPADASSAIDIQVIEHKEDHPDGHLSETQHAAAEPAMMQDGVEHMLTSLATAEGIVIPQEESTSSYPDPSIFSNQRIGMGYYEQDDTPDKILFDPYQAPSTDSLQRDQSDVSEFVKRSIRAAKRKAKKDREDPDFIIKSHKKPRPAQETDFLASMDPALFNESAQPRQDGHDSPEDTSEQQRASPAQTLQPAHQATNTLRALQRYVANEPLLRHAKPKTSYAEVDDADVEDNEAFTQQLQESQKPSINAAGSPPDELDAVKVAVGDTLKEDQGLNLTEEDGTRGDDSSNRNRRGRPPKAVGIQIEAESAAVNSSEEPPGPSERRGRNTRSGLQEPSVTSQSEEQDSDRAAKRRPGRPCGSTRPSRASARGSGRGGARRPEASSGTRQVITNDRGSPRNQQFMSLAERMALRGKKFKIGKRKTPGTPTSNPAEKKQETSERAGAGMGVEVRVAPPAETVPTRQAWVSVNRDSKKKALTAVSLGEDVSDEKHITASESGSGSSDNEDIPARVGASRRGRGGRGRGRGRPRGRPSGRGR